MTSPKTNATHTPGPWSVVDTRDDRRRLQIHHDSAPIVIASVHDSDDRVGAQRRDGISREAYANARLIAAAPDLLAALEAAVVSEELSKAVDVLARTALRKARGQ